MATKKLIEVALPLEKINASAAYEKMPGIGAHPRGLHLWWARRPFTAARAVIWASLVDDPSSHPELFPTEEEQNNERLRLFKILEELSEWKNSNNADVLNKARAEIKKSVHGQLPALLDPFAGGGAIPLEAQRLGLKAYAHDLNPVAVVINKSMIEVAPRFCDKPAVNPESQYQLGQGNSEVGYNGLASDVRFYGHWMKQEAKKQIGHLYPNIQLPPSLGSGSAPIVTWLWARTIVCPNPACSCEFPLIKSLDLCKKKGREASLKLVVNGNTVRCEVQQKKADHSGTITRSGAKCPCCGTAVDFPYIRKKAQEKGWSSIMTAVIAEGKRGKLYLTPTVEQISAARVHRPEEFPSGTLSGKSRVNVSLYGIDETGDLFTNRQLTSMVVFSDLLATVQTRIEQDAIKAGLQNDHVALADGGSGAYAYAQAVTIYLAFAVDRLADFSTAVSRWSVSNEKAMNCFSKQAIPMTWDYPEVNVLYEGVGGFSTITNYIADCILTLPSLNVVGHAEQSDAQSDCGLRNIIVSTDPPYYDNISYADLSDFFYVWLRHNLKGVYPDIFRTLLVPKTEELVATPFRFEGSVDRARTFFESGMLETCKQLYLYARDDIPVTIYYAYKQSDSDDSDGSVASSGWETMLTAIIKAGFSITGTWPMRTEQTYRAVSMGANALASSIVLVCRKRPHNAAICTRRNFINELKRELRPALQKLQRSNIAPVDLQQSAIGPGMGVFSKYAQVLEADGTPMSVRSALKVINQELDLYFNEQDSEIDSESRFCVELFSLVAFNEMKFGDANTLANAKGTSVASMVSHGTLYAQKGVVHLIERSELPEKIDEHESSIWKLCQQLSYRMEKEGIEGCAKAVANMFGTNAERAKDLAYRLYTIAERKKWAAEALVYNNLVVSWPEIQSRAAELKAIQPEQLTIFDN